MILYKSTQFGFAIVAILMVIISFLLMTNKPGSLYASGLLLLIGALFSALTVKVDTNSIEWFFGPSFLKKHIELVEITSTKKVRTKWYNGFGIRHLSQGVLYNVSGLDAVEITLKNGERILIGTNQPDDLIAAIQEAKAKVNS